MSLIYSIYFIEIQTFIKENTCLPKGYYWYKNNKKLENCRFVAEKPEKSPIFAARKQGA